MKPRSDSKLKTLPVERQEQIVEWLMTPKSETCPGGLKHAQEQLGADGLKVSTRALSEFWPWWRLRERFSSASERAAQVEELLAEKNPNLSPDKIRELGQAVFTMEAVESQDRESYVSVERLQLDRESAHFKAELEREKIKLAERRVKVAERKLDQLKGALTDGELSDEQRVHRMKQVFGIA